MDATDFYTMTAREKHGLPDDWHAWRFRFEKGDDGSKIIIMEGAVVKNRHLRGPKKGRPNFSTVHPGESRMVTVTLEDIEKTKAAWGKKTGKCPRCIGAGRRITGHSTSKGPEYTECKDCSGTGAYKESV